ncbi:MAG: hypothetical protein HDT29_01165 [Clostridiales bacterium]|nr:hypothetical protein [Clostridiales bacterium]
MGKGMGYAGKRKKAKKTVEKRYTAYYVISGVGLFGLPNMTWTIIAGILAGVAVLAFVFMLLQKRAYNKALEDMEDAKEEYTRNREEANFMRYANGGMSGGMGMNGQGVAYAPQPQFALEDIRGIVADTMSNMLPSMQQYLPQEASYNDQLVQQLIAQNEEIIHNMAQEREMLMQKFSEQQKESVDEDVIEKLVEKLAKQQVAEKEAEKEAAATAVSEELLKKLIEGQEMLMRKLSEKDEEKTVKVMPMPMPTNGNEEIIKSLIEGQRSIMEKLVDKPNEKHVEKIVEKEAVKEVPVEKKIVEVEKVVPMPVEKPAKSSKAPAPRLTLDEAYAKLSATQKKIFDTLKNYALSKEKCKEKKSTYFTVLGQSTVNPLVKLTIKKNTTVAMFKMEDEYMKDIRKNATSDGTKVKVKETELIVGDNQALSTAKEMIDLREDQIERYNEYLKEQKSMRKK